VAAGVGSIAGSYSGNTLELSNEVLGEAVFNSSYFRKCDVDHKVAGEVRLCVATVNVQTLSESLQEGPDGLRVCGRAAVFQKQFGVLGVHLVGVQEARSTRGSWQAGEYHVVSSNAVGGVRDCQLWVRSSRASCSGGNGTLASGEWCLAPRDVVVAD